MRLTATRLLLIRKRSQQKQRTRIRSARTEPIPTASAQTVATATTSTTTRTRSISGQPTTRVTPVKRLLFRPVWPQLLLVTRTRIQLSVTLVDQHRVLTRRAHTVTVALRAALDHTRMAASLV